MYIENLQAQQTYLKSLFDRGYQYYLKVTPATHVRVTQGDRWIFKSSDEYLKDYDKRKGRRSFNRKQQIVRSVEHRKELQWVANRDKFDIKYGQFIMIFMKHMPKTWRAGKRKPGKRDLMAWMPMENRPDVDNYLKKMIDSLLPEDRKIWCCAPMKIWIPDHVKEGTYFINVPDFFQYCVEYLKKKIDGS